MSFEPDASLAPAPDEPPPVRTVTAKLPPPPESRPAVESPTPPAWALLPPRVPSVATTIALVSAGSLMMLLLVAGLITFVAGSLRGGASSNAPPAASSALASAFAGEAPAPAPPVASTEPTASPSSVASGAAVTTARFSASAAKRAFDGVSRGVAKCKKGTRWGVANATVTFDPDGSVHDVHVGPPFTGTPTGRCVGDQLGTVHIPAFGGAPVVYVTSFYVAPR